MLQPVEEANEEEEEEEATASASAPAPVSAHAGPSTHVLVSVPVALAGWVEAILAQKLAQMEVVEKPKVRAAV